MYCVQKKRKRNRKEKEKSKIETMNKKHNRKKSRRGNIGGPNIGPQTIASVGSGAVCGIEVGVGVLNTNISIF